MNMRITASASRSMLASLALLLAGTVQAASPSAGSAARRPDADRSDATAPVAQPETDRSMSNSGALVPSQPVRPEGTEEATVPKTPMDKSAASSADVGTDKTNEKTKRPSSGGDGSTSPKR